MRRLSQKNRKRLIISVSILLFLAILFCFVLFFPEFPEKASGFFKSVFSIKPNDGPEPSGSPSEVTKDVNKENGESGEINGQSLNNGASNDLPQKGFPYVSDGLVKIDAKEILLDCINLNDRLSDGTYADVRIRYPNGEEYTVVSGLRVIRLPDDSENIYFCLTETELLYMSSARSDCEKYKGTYLYPAAAHDKPEESSKIGNYRPNRDVITLINEEKLLETEKADEIFLARERLEERLLHAYSNSVVYDMTDFLAEINDKLPGGLQSDTTGGYWVYE